MRTNSRSLRVAVLVLVLVVGAIAFAQYGRALAYPFSRDDAIHLTMTERWDRPPSRLLEHFREDFFHGRPWTGLYRPLTATTIQITSWASGVKPLPLRVGNVLLLVATALAVAAFAIRGGVSPPAAALLATSIVVHPLFSEDVLEVVSRAELQSLSCVFGVAALFVGSRKARPTSWSAAIVGALGFLAALLSKEGAFAALPALLVVLVRPSTQASSAESTFGERGARRGTLRRTHIVAALLLAVALVAVLSLRSAVLGDATRVDLAYVTTLDNCLVGENVWIRLVTAIANLGRYLGLLVWPASLSADYSFAAIRPLHDVGDLRFWFGIVALVGGGAWLFVAWQRRRTVELFGLLLAGASWFLVSSIVTPIGTIFAERLFSASACGILVAFVAAVDRTIRSRPIGATSRRVVGVLALVVVVALGARTFVRAGDWRDSTTLYERALSVVPDSARVQCSVANSLQERHDPAAADVHYRRALEIKPDYRRPMSSFAEIALEKLRTERRPESLAQAYVWSWLAAHAPGAGPDDSKYFGEIADLARRAALPRSELARAAETIADEHRDALLYRAMRDTLVPARH